MRCAVSLSLAVSLGVMALLPSNVQAGPFKYRGGPWDRRAASNFSTAGTTYYVSPSRDDPSLPSTASSYYAPSGYAAYSEIPWRISSPSRTDPAPMDVYSHPMTYNTYSTGPEYGRYYYSPSGYTTSPSRYIPWKESSPSRDNPQ